MVARQTSEAEDDFIRMQQEAIMRVRDMQSRARATLENAGVHIENSNADYPLEQAQNGRTQSDLFAQSFSANQSSNDPHSDAVHSDAVRSDTARSAAAHADTSHAGAARSGATHESKRPVEKDEPQQGEPSIINAMGLNISLDNDQLLLLLTIYLLIKDGADKWLILSLAYVMLT